MDELITWLRAQLDDDERVAREASRRDPDGFTPTGEHWHWVEPEHDQVLTLDPMLDEYLNDGGRAALRSVEEYPTSMPYTLPHFVISYAEETSTVDGMHIARWDPARVLAEVEAKRAILDDYDILVSAIRRVDDVDGNQLLYARREARESDIRWLAQPYAGRPGWREEWQVSVAT